MRRSNKSFGVALLIALVSAFAVSVAEDVKFQPQKLAFEDFPVMEETAADLNCATFEELVAVDSLGEKTAQKIIEYRQRRPFETVEDLMLIKGFDTKKLEKVKGKVYVKK